MKKSLKALILCGLASLVMFAVVYASPIIAQAATVSFDVYEEGTTNVIGRATVTYDETLLSPSGYTGEVGYLCATDVVAIQIIFNVTSNPSSIDSLNASYDFVFAGTHYSGTAVLTNSGTHPTEFNYTAGATAVTGTTGYGKEINDLKGQIGNISNDSTLTGENRVIEFKVGDALPKDVIAALANSTGVTLKFTFVYEGYEFCTTITSEAAKSVYDPEVDWAGPCYLADNFPTVWTGKTA